MTGAKPVMKNCERGRGMGFTGTLRNSKLSWSGEAQTRRHAGDRGTDQVARITMVAVKSFQVPKQMS